jgi:hypothetical protein
MGKPGRDLHLSPPGEERDRPGGAGGGEGGLGITEESDEKKRRDEKSWGQKSQATPSPGHSPSCLESLCLWRPVRPRPTKELSPLAFCALGPPVRRCCGGRCYRLAPWPVAPEKGGLRSALAAKAASALVCRAHACFVLTLAENQPNRKRVRGGPSGGRRGGGASSAAASGTPAGEARQTSPAGLCRSRGPARPPSGLEGARRAGPGQVTVETPKRRQWAGRGWVQERAGGTHIPGAPLAGLQSARALGLSRWLHQSAEGALSRTELPRSLLCSRPREAHFDGSLSRLAGGQSARAPLVSPPPRNLRAPPLSCPRGLGLPLSKTPSAGLGGGLYPWLVRVGGLSFALQASPPPAPRLLWGSPESKVVLGRSRRRHPRSPPAGRFPW